MSSVFLCDEWHNKTPRKAEPLLNSSAVSQCNTGYARGWHCITLPGVLKFTPLSNICPVPFVTYTVLFLCWLTCQAHGSLGRALQLIRFEKLLYLLLYTFHNSTHVSHDSNQLVTTGRKSQNIFTNYIRCQGNKLEEFFVWCFRFSSSGTHFIAYLLSVVSGEHSWISLLLSVISYPSVSPVNVCFVFLVTVIWSPGLDLRQCLIAYWC